MVPIRYITEEEAKFEVNTEYGPAQHLVEMWASENMKDYNGYEFGGWMTAASVKLDKIPAGNTQNIVLYPYFTSPHTVIFVDPDSNILAWCFFNDTNIKNIQSTFDLAKENLSNPGDFNLNIISLNVTTLPINITPFMYL